MRSLVGQISAAELGAIKNLLEMEERAMALLPKTARLFIGTGAETGATTAANRAAWGKWSLVPRVLRDVSAVSTACTVLGHHLDLPVLPGPASFHDRVHPDGELAVAAATAAAGTAAIILGAAAKPLPEIVTAAGGAPLFFQLYTTMKRDGTGRPSPPGPLYPPPASCILRVVSRILLTRSAWVQGWTGSTPPPS